MFFAYMVLRPSAGPLPPDARLELWYGVFRGFFPWVWASIALLLVTGYGMMFLYLGSFAGAGLHVHVMQATGVVMMLLFLHLFFAPWRRFASAVRSGQFQDASGHLVQIRRIVATNLALGILTIVVGASGRYW